MGLASGRLRGGWGHRQRAMWVFLSLLFGGLLMGLVVGLYGAPYAVLLLGIAVLIPMVAGIVGDLKFGVALSLVIGFFTVHINKFVNAPMGIMNDVLLFFLGVSLMLRLIRERDFSRFEHPVTVFLAIWIFYNLIAVLNPVAATHIGWLYAVRPIAGIAFIYFVTLYALKDLATVKFFLKVILGLTVLAGLYGLKQEWIGFTDGEMAWLQADPLRFMLIYQWGRLRVFSFFSDPTTMGIIFVYISFFILALMTGPFSHKYKIIGGLSIAVLLLASAYGGSRTPVVLIPIGMIYFIILNANVRTFIGSLIFFMLGTVFMLKSTSSGVIYRLQSAFSPDDASVRVRLEHQEFVQPFLRENPFGWGLASIGEWGKRFNKDSWMADFAHDSGFIRIAAELGYVGLTIYMMFLVAVMYFALKYYFLVRDKQIKAIYLGLNLVFFILIISNFPQETIVILPTSLFFNVMVAIAVRLKDLDPYYVKTYKKMHHEDI